MNSMQIGQARDARPIPENLHLFLKRKKGERFQVINGRFTPISSLSAKISYFFHKTQQQREVAQVLGNEVIRFLASSDETENSSFLPRLFKEKIARLPQNMQKGIPFLQHEAFHPFLETIASQHESAQISQAYQLTSYEQKDLETLFSLKTGDLLRIDRNGQLKRVQGFFQNLRSIFTAAHDNNAVSEKIQLLLHRFETLPLDQQYPKALQRLLFKKLPLLIGKAFKPGWIVEGGQLERMISPEIFKVRQNLADKRQQLEAYYSQGAVPFNDQLAIETKQLLLQWASLEDDLTRTLGLTPKRFQASSSGTYLFYDRNKRPLAIVKPADEGPRGDNNPYLFSKFKRLFKFLGERTGLLSGEESKAEELAYLLSQKLQLHLVPPTCVKTIRSSMFFRKVEKKCSFQLFIPQLHSAHSFLKIPSHLEKMPVVSWKFFFHFKWPWQKESLADTLAKNLPVKLLEKVAVCDFLTGNIDRHFENLLMRSWKQPIASGTNPIENFLPYIFRSFDSILGICIDNGSSFPSAHAKGYLSTRYMHEIGDFPHANQPFSQELRRQLLKDETFWNQLLLEMAMSLLEEIPELQAPEMKALKFQFAKDILPLPHRTSPIKEYAYQATLSLRPPRRRFQEINQQMRRSCKQIKVLQENISVLLLFLRDETKTISDLCHVKKQMQFNRILAETNSSL